MKSIRWRVLTILALVRTRINEFGTTEPVVQIAGNCRLVVELPGETDPARAKSIVERTAFLEFRITDARDQLRLALPAIDATLRRAGVTSAIAEGARSREQEVQQLIPRGLELRWGVVPTDG